MMKQALTFKLLAVLLIGLGSAQASVQQSWRFKVYLDDEAIGYHSFRLMRQDNATHVAVDAKFDVKLWFFTAYSYLHQNYEIWQGECLHSIRSQTDDNGDEQFVYGNRNNDAFSLRTVEGEKQFDGCIKTFAFWDADLLQATHMLNSQTGELLPVEVIEVGMVSIEVRNNRVKARQYRLVTEEFTIDLWYSAKQQNLLAVQSTIDGSILRYQML